MKLGSRIIIAALFSVVSTAIIVWVSPARLSPPTWDGLFYYQMAAGQSEKVALPYHAAYILHPFAARLLHPYAVRMVSQAFGIPLMRAFYIVSCAALFVFMLGASLYFARRAPSLLIAMPLIITPALLRVFQNYYYQDLFHAALTSLFFLVMTASPYLALPFLVLMELARESTILAIVTLAGVALYRGEGKLAVAAAVAGGVGAAIVRTYSPGGFGNEHGIPQFLFYGLKVGYDFCQNVLGLVFWTDTSARFGDCHPRLVVQIPAWLHLGRVRQAGLCEFNPVLPLRTLTNLMTCFGALPVVLLCLGVSGIRVRLELDEAVALVYGVCAYVLSPVIGIWPSGRYAFFAWPAFLLAIPAIAERSNRAAISRSSAAALAAPIVASIWLPAAIGLLPQMQSSEIAILLAALGVEVVTWILSYRVCRTILASQFPRISTKPTRAADYTSGRTKKPRSPARG